ncbi:MAG TPA: TVP38/TMEM64 family protein [Stellaceae bacterium]|nr:TVP38/TMEM64 family protein [Stellaceae bacterium]
MTDLTTRRPLLRGLMPLALLLLAAVVFILAGGRHYLTFATLAEHRAVLCDLAARGGLLAVIGFTLGYAGLTALSVPGAAILTLASGFLFGPWLGAFYALIGATLGASAVFLAARGGLAGLVERAGPPVRRIKEGFSEDGFSYLLSLRLLPIFPFWLVNLVAGASGMRLPTYLAATFLGMIPGALVYAGIGNGLGALIAAGQHPDLDMIFRPDILLPLLGLAALALLPVAYKRWAGKSRTVP